MALIDFGAMIPSWPIPPHPLLDDRIFVAAKPFAGAGFLQLPLVFGLVRRHCAGARRSGVTTPRSAGGVPQNAVHAPISRRRFSRASPRR